MYEFLQDVQAVLVEILAEVDRVCRENRIVYSISGGTVLGLVRHNGRFIPWDDDCDVEMRAADYYRFLRACKRGLDTGRFTLQNKHTEPAFPYVFSKIRRHGTTDLDLNLRRLPLHWGLAVDIFPTFAKLKWRWADALSSFITGLAGALAWAPMEDGGWAAALHKLRLAGVGCRACMRLLWLMDRRLPATGGYTMKFKFGNGKTYENENLLPAAEYEFEGLKVYGPAKPERYLDEKNDKYGDWRLPAPPQNGLQYHHRHILDAKRDYTGHLALLENEKPPPP